MWIFQRIPLFELAMVSFLYPVLFIYSCQFPLYDPIIDGQMLGFCEITEVGRDYTTLVSEYGVRIHVGYNNTSKVGDIWTVKSGHANYYMAERWVFGERVW